MARDSEVLFLSEKRPKPLVPVTVVLGMPERVHRYDIERWIASREISQVFLEARHLTDGQGIECTECVLLRETLELLNDTLARKSCLPEGIWLEVPVGLNPRTVVEELAKLPGIRIDAIATWIDTAKFRGDFTSDLEWRDREISWDRPLDSNLNREDIVETFTWQLEGCNVFFFVGLEQLPTVEQDFITETLKQLNPSAVHVLRDNKAWWGANAFSWKLFSKQGLYPPCAWNQVLSAKIIGAQYFRSKRPFHPARFQKLMANWPETILRTYGTIWLASHNNLAISVNQTGPTAFLLNTEGYWIGAGDADETHYALLEHPELRDDWDDKFGDRITEIAFVFSGTVNGEWQRDLDRCVLSDIEMRQDWSRFHNPFPALNEDSENEHPFGHSASKINPLNLRLVESTSSINE